MTLLPRIGLIARRYCQTATTSATRPPSSTGINANVKGLSSRCVKTTKEPIGPGATSTGEYKVPEYFCFNRIGYYEAEVEMAKFRCPQPSALRK